MKRTLLYLLVCAGFASNICAQSASDALIAGEKGQMVPYNLSDEGVAQPVRWGIDTAWRWSWWPLRATNHMRECVSLGRVTIDPRTSGSYTELSAELKAGLDEQLSWLRKSGVKVLYLLAGNTSGGAWQTSFRTPFVTDIALAVQYLQSKGYEVTAISPFNEPDYAPNNAPNATEMATVARLIRQNDTLKDIDVAGPSCLNPDYANAWWSTMSGSLQIGNTHQLAGTFDNFAGFYAAVRDSGKKSAGDEMHNINDALIGMNYGMTDGIWWSDFGSYTRAELGRASLDGERIGYAENRSAWTSAAVFRRHSLPLAEAFLGTSERQAGESAFTFVSQDRLAYYDGHGPYYEYTKATPGGTGYDAGQTNSEYVVEITQGEDVPVGPVEGTFKIVNKATGKLLTAAALSNDANVTQAKESRTANQSWVIAPVAPRAAGDFAHVTIQAAKNTSFYLDALKYGGDNGARILMYSGGGNECERWHLTYQGNGYYTITNNDSGLSLEGSSNNTEKNTTGVVQWERTGTYRQLWRFVPATATVDEEAPTAPTDLRAQGLTGSIRLTWQANTESDLLGYMIYRYNEQAQTWETIGRGVEGQEFTDNYCPKGRTLRYRIRAVDQSWNVGEPSTEVSATTSTEKGLIGHWKMRTDLADGTDNHMTAASTGASFVTDEMHPGITLDGTKDYVALPYHAADMTEMTFSAWVKSTSTTAWQRIFDFGRSTTNYMMLTTSNGSRMHFEVCKDGAKQSLDATRRLTSNRWTHVVVTLGNGGAAIYLDGQLNASSADITLRPSDVRPTLCYLGRSLFDADPLFKGSIGDVRLYNHVLNADEIGALYYQDQINAARDLAADPMNADVRNALLQAVANADAAVATADPEAITTAIEALTAPMKAAMQSAAAYRPLGEMLAWSQQIAAEHPQNDSEAAAEYESNYAETETGYHDGNYADADIADIANEVRAFTNQYLMADAAKSTKNTDITHLLTNADFADGTLAGWTLTTNATTYRGTLAYGCFEVWNHTFRLSQTLPGMPRGKYTLQVQGFYRNGGKANSASTDVNALLFIGNETTPIAPISRAANAATSDGDWYAYETNKNVPNNMEAAAAAFNTLRRYRPTTSVNSLAVTYDPEEDGVLTLGLKKTKAVNDDWTIINQFTLIYTGEDNTGIREIENSKLKIQNDAIYDLSGRRISVPSVLPKGVYIKNGKKILKR